MYIHIDTTYKKSSCSLRMTEKEEASIRKGILLPPPPRLEHGLCLGGLIEHAHGRGRVPPPPRPPPFPLLHAPLLAQAPQVDALQDTALLQLEGLWGWGAEV